MGTVTKRQPPPPPVADLEGEHVTVMSQTQASEKTAKDGDVRIEEDQAAASAKSKEASTDGMKNYFVS